MAEIISLNEYRAALPGGYPAACLGEGDETDQDEIELGLFIIDLSRPDSPIVHASGECEAITGYTIAETIGQSSRFLWGAGTDWRSQILIGQAIADAREITVDILVYRKGGEPFWKRLQLTPYFDDGQPSPRYYFAIFNEVDEPDPL